MSCARPHQKRLDLGTPFTTTPIGGTAGDGPFFGTRFDLGFGRQLVLWMDMTLGVVTLATIRLELFPAHDADTPYGWTAIGPAAHAEVNLTKTGRTVQFLSTPGPGNYQAVGSPAIPTRSAEARLVVTTTSGAGSPGSLTVKGTMMDKTLLSGFNA